ncbi:hypothetical protein COT97_02420 [Candidatus Falkowbacteria bacterium CG10_big_fil_rev_8_21_14_0_10_39_11]|uniref:Uncharacterized protein n=1 Tax=Candidatus Falkowbacteria bacterium CG10_big_fil_rev_8_21_14_0_10_39_11 TaxID=1974565 RepID=A0A2H0V7E6_9BACT|nr:MAG: hypothetical protein COT97_02420 [Candidatus Falkowbacteria bacterium CG10_big_fil_rev_8_21_14_0_10_39_11]
MEQNQDRDQLSKRIKRLDLYTELYKAGEYLSAFVMIGCWFFGMVLLLNVSDIPADEKCQAFWVMMGLFGASLGFLGLAFVLWQMMIKTMRQSVDLGIQLKIIQSAECFE